MKERKFKYQVRYYTAEEGDYVPQMKFQNALNEMGAEGWEVVSIEHERDEDGLPRGWWYYLKREYLGY